MGSGEDSILNLFKETTSITAIQEYVAAHAVHPSPGVAAAGLTALSLRSEAATRNCIEELTQAIRAFKQSSDRYATRILVLTWALVFLTVLLVAPVLADLAHLLFHHK
jgi:hypothetical protein